MPSGPRGQSQNTHFITNMKHLEYFKLCKTFEYIKYFEHSYYIWNILSKVKHLNIWNISNFGIEKYLAYRVDDYFAFHSRWMKQVLQPFIFLQSEIRFSGVNVVVGLSNNSLLVAFHFSTIGYNSEIFSGCFFLNSCPVYCSNSILYNRIELFLMFEILISLGQWHFSTLKDFWNS